MHSFASRWRGRITNSHLPALLVLTALNVSICWRLFKVEYTANFGSIEGSFIAIARYLSRHWVDSSWWPLWHCGMPYADTYVPLLHLTAAAVATVAHLSAARAYHAVTGAAYALGPATLYLMAVRLGARRGAAFLSAVFYSLFSPSALFMPGVAQDIGGLWYSRRLQVLTVYGEGPHVSAMTLLPLVILALQNALTGRTRRTLAFAACAVALVFLTNVPGTMALGLAVFCWICAQGREQLAAAWKIAAAASLWAYALACYGIPLSSLLTVGGNIGPMHSGFSNSLKHGPVLLLLVFSLVAAAGYVLARIGVPLIWRFALLFFGLVAPLAVTARGETFELLPQVGRLHLEAEMGACLLLGLLGWWIYLLIPRWIRPIVLALCIAPAFLQWQAYRWRAHVDTQRADLPHRSEYTSARWLDEHMNGGRVWTGGSTSFWLNSFTDTPQVIGCCDQGLAMPVLAIAPYVVNSPLSPQQTARLAKPWLEALGVQALVINGPNSTDDYKDVRLPDRYRALFPVLHEENGDTIYSVLPPGTSLAHTIHPGEQVRIPARGQKVPDSDIFRYAATLEDSARPTAPFRWLSGSRAVIRANLQPADLVSVQVAYFPGWKAEVQGRRVPVTADGLGFLLIQPQCRGECEIALRWTGNPDGFWSAAISLMALFFAIAATSGHAIMNTMTAAPLDAKPRYQFKAGPYSSHTLLLARFPERGEGRRVLDLGCAAGYLSEILADRAFSVFCIDWPGTPHPATVEFSGADLDNGIGPVPGQFQYIICADLIEHLRDPLRLLKECREKLAPGGTLMASLPNSGHWYFRWNVLLGRFPQHERGLFDSTHLHFYNWDGWVNLLNRAGFKVETVCCSSVPFELALPNWEGSFLVRGLEWLSVTCARVWKTLFAYQFIVTARGEDPR